MSDDTYLITAEEIEALDGLQKTHFLKENARRTNKSLGDLTGLTGLGVHLIEVPPGAVSTEYHVHYFEDECVYILSGIATARIGDATHSVKAGDFLGYRKGGLAHDLINTGDAPLRCLVIGQRLDHDVADYPEKAKRIFRNKGLEWNVVDHDHLVVPTGAGKK